MKFKTGMLALVIMFFSAFAGVRVCAVSGQEYDASAVFKTGYSYSSNVIEGNISVYVADELYNENVKLSYHIEDANGNMLVFENERISISGMQLPAEVPVRIDLNGLFAETGISRAVVCFDLVDEENVYWFADNPDRSCEFEKAVLDNGSIVSEKPHIETVIMHDAPSVIHDDDLVINVEVRFGSPELYNEGVKLSYKVYNSDMVDIAGENERYPLAYDGEKGTAQVKLHLSDISGVSKDEEMTICFDLVDETNLYWFGNSPDVDLVSSSVVYKYDLAYNLKAQYGYILRQQYVQIIINIAGIVFVSIVFVKIRRRLKSE